MPDCFAYPLLTRIVFSLSKIMICGLVLTWEFVSVSMLEVDFFFSSFSRLNHFFFLILNHFFFTFESFFFPLSREIVFYFIKFNYV